MVQRFSTTRWSLVLSAGGAGHEARSALGELCHLYWGPVYLYVRRQLNGDGESALDLTQQLFIDLLERNDLARVRPWQGRFRSWILTCAKNAVRNARDYRYAQKRDLRKLVWIDAEGAELWSRRELMDFRDPERAYERGFTYAVLQRALLRLRQIYTDRGKLPLFEAMQHLLTTPTGEPCDYDISARALGVKPATLKVQVHRMRETFAALVRAEVGELVGDPAQIDPELRYMETTLQPEPA